MGDNKPHISVVIVGNADAGKSTLCGQLVNKCSNTMHFVPMGGPPQINYYAQVLASYEERTLKYTYDTRYWRIFTKKYFVTIVDSPGRSKYLKNLITSISLADCAILVVSASIGEFEAALSSGKIREQSVILFAFGVKQVIVAVNKMDDNEIEWSQSRFENITKSTIVELRAVGFKEENIKFIPTSTLTGDNLVAASTNLQWYKGSTLVEAIDNFDPPARMVDKPFRMPILKASRIPGIGTVVTGKIVSGTLTPRTCVSLAHPQAAAEMKQIEMHHQQLHDASCGDIIGFGVRPFALKELPRGNVVGLQRMLPPQIAAVIVARIIILNHPGKIKKGYTPVLSCHTAHVSCKFESIIYKVDRKTGKETEKEPPELKNGDCAMVRMRPLKPICVEPFVQFPALGRFVLRDMQQIIGVGVVMEVDYVPERKYGQ